MKENPRLKEILDKLEAGDILTIGNKVYGPISEIAKNVLLAIRNLPDNSLIVAVHATWR